MQNILKEINKRHKAMSHLIKPKNYHALLDLQQTEIAIKKIKDFFLSSISTELRLRRVTAPLFVLKGLGMNDDLNGVERGTSGGGSLAGQMETGHTG